MAFAVRELPRAIMEPLAQHVLGRPAIWAFQAVGDAVGDVEQFPEADRQIIPSTFMEHSHHLQPAREARRIKRRLQRPVLQVVRCGPGNAAVEGGCSRVIPCCGGDKHHILSALRVAEHEGIPPRTARPILIPLLRLQANPLGFFRPMGKVEARGAVDDRARFHRVVEHVVPFGTTHHADGAEAVLIIRAASPGRKCKRLVLPVYEVRTRRVPDGSSG